MGPAANVAATKAQATERAPLVQGEVVDESTRTDPLAEGRRLSLVGSSR